jgi:hypothetical protein
VPDPDAMSSLDRVVNRSVSKLFDIGLDSRQERIFVTDCPTNVIIMTHRFYGLDANDDNINEFMENNDIGLNEVLQIRKGRRLVYYI